MQLAPSLLLLALATACVATPPADPIDRARALHAQLPVIDGHNDLPGRIRERTRVNFDTCDLSKPCPEFHTDLPRLRTGGVGAQFWSVFVPASTEAGGDALERTLEQVDLVHRMVRQYPEWLELAPTAADVERIRTQGKLACMLGIEGGYSIEGSLPALRLFHRLGVRYMTLTHTLTTAWADSSTDEPRHGGLAPFGEEVVREMNRIGMLVDLSHVSDDCVRDVLALSKAPVIASHSSARALANHPRNLSDELLAAIGAHGGVVMVNFGSNFIDPVSAEQAARTLVVQRELKARFPDKADYDKALAEFRATLVASRGTVELVADHVEHIARVAGVEHVGLGSDFDGVGSLPEGLDSADLYPNLTRVLIERGWSDANLRKLCGENVLRVLREAERVARASN
ncbi:MAG: membrane dipeptidase [Planctomycetaceae bacterium]|nr:membrane dipeptidase [Planctomycetaceae bacterium]